MALLTTLYDQLKDRLAPVTRAVPHLKIYRVLAALYPEAMTSIASTGALNALTRAMGGKGLRSPEQHVWVRERIDGAIGASPPDSWSQAERLSLAWLLYAQFVQTGEQTQKETRPGDETKLIPLPASRRRRGMTAIKGSFSTVLLTLEFVRDGVTRADLLEFLRGQLPGQKDNSLATFINVLRSELGVIGLGDADRYVLTERGDDVLESQDPDHLADWILTRILGADMAVVALRDRGPLARSELAAVIKSMNPGWTTDYAPQAVIGWLRSMGVIESIDQYRQSLTPLGKQWAARIYWTPEPLVEEPEEDEVAVATATTAVPATLNIPDLSTIVSFVQKAGHFPSALVARLHVGLWAHHRRHLAILTGLSGSGKTLLAREYAKAITPDGGADRIFITAVQPGWYDPGALLGFVNPLQPDAYVRPAFLDFLMRAASDPTRVYVAVLDEMNLSHPEQYMAPLLSAMETGTAVHLHTEADIFDGVPRSIMYPSNLVLIGTVNMDETTHGLSDKVLDRAFVLDFWDVDLSAYPHWGKRSLTPPHEARAREVLSALMQALMPARLHFGWRVVDDVLDFLERAEKADTILPFDAALDSVIYAKILPKLRGEDSQKFRAALSNTDDVLRLSGLEQSRSKVVELRRDLETTGSARFWR
jgi:MoxR-like ATPase